ncbi:UV damage endonuclease uvsE [Fonsecaea monophora]|uniref:UV damage endonuclease uvsE n=1 Tax=Fonsecaea monophora TaxID=254056 RepID=A0A177ETD6_9EURO|nr:UV damage endonuclease uvsE [Fonsecaea monophora]OAG34691.1 UV damage endonuclease uvsE [Fonsecaea monophora]
MELAGDAPQDYHELLVAEPNRSSEEGSRTQAAQDDIIRREQEELEALFEPIRRLQDAWNREDDLVIHQEPEMAQSFAAQREREGNRVIHESQRHMHAKIQAEDARQLDEDAKLARALFEIENEVRASPEGYGHQSTWTDELMGSGSQWSLGPLLPRRRRTGTSPFQWLKRALGLATNQSAVPVSAGISHPHQNILVPNEPNSIRSSPPRDANPVKGIGTIRSSGGVESAREKRERQRSSTADRDAISIGLSVTEDVQDAWKHDPRKNESSARHAKEAGATEQRASAGLGRPHRKEWQQRRAGQKGQEEQTRTRAARPVECTACTEPVPRKQTCRLGCKHRYCQTCLETAIQMAVKDKKAFRCCSVQVEPDVVSRWLPAEVQSAYKAEMLGFHPFGQLCRRDGSVPPLLERDLSTVQEEGARRKYLRARHRGPSATELERDPEVDAVSALQDHGGADLGMSPYDLSVRDGILLQLWESEMAVSRGKVYSEVIQAISFGNIWHYGQSSAAVSLRG